METFPATAKLRFPYSKQRASAVLRSDMDDGVPKQIKTKSRVMVSRNCTYTFDSYADYQSFLAWYRDNISYGAAWFNWTNPENAIVTPARIVNKLDEEVPLRRALDRWDVKMTIETWG